MTVWGALLLVIAAGLGALVVHEFGHAVAALLVGGRVLRVRPSLRAIRIDAALPPGRRRAAAFLVGGVAANLVAASALSEWDAPCARVASLLQAVVAGLNALPVGTSDGARLWCLWRARR